MKERPILFSAPMVRAILAGTKTQTRRIVKPQPELDPNYSPSRIDRYTTHPEFWWPSKSARSMVSISDMASIGPYGSKGDRLWVKETHARDGQLIAYEADGWAGAVCSDGGGGWLRLPHGFVTTTGTDDLRRGNHDKEGARFGLGRYGGRWKPSIHMPRWASRITLEVTGVHVETLHEINSADAVAEGVVDDSHGWNGNPTYPLARFRSLWIGINGQESWDANPFVWVVSFKRADAAARAA